ncbi:MFS general substrate transporter [Trichoderma longibrachiatum ATCC 18648]|uniref:MFS general substrate transporter n=1 Tax=Trichoderma longibrachiatum ATCC 18648 TaxID=983965 RepID=A0A2T4C1V5_TRILO|nr:MFS general substrate transporter [Trichoderma longibrachiatum ATCC 18648]
MGFLSDTEAWRSSEGIVTFAVAFAIFTDGMVYDLVIPFLPELFTGRLRTPPEEVDYWAALSLESFGMALLITNWIAGYIDGGGVAKSRPFLVGIGIMLVATLLFFLSKSPYLIIFARVLQGASEALVWVSGIAFLVSQVDEANLGVCMGYTTLGATVGELLGPLVGGYLYERLGHWVVFAVVEAVIAVDVALRLLVKERDKGSASQKQDPTNATKGLSEADALLGTSSAVSHGTTDTCDSILSTDLEHAGDDDQSALSGTTETEDDDDVAALRTLGWNWLSSVSGAAMACVVRSALEATIPIYVLRHFGWTSSAGGGVMFALLLPMVGGPLVGKLTTLYGPRWFSTISALSCGVFMVTLGFLTGDDTTTRLLFVVNIGLVGLCISLATTTQTTAISAAAQRTEALRSRIRAGGVELSWGLKVLTPGMMLSGLSTAWALGLFLGPACGHVFHFSTNQEWKHLCWFLGMLSLLTGIYCSCTWTRWR